MFCPSCGLEDTQSNQYCRACGTDLRPVQVALETPDKISASAVSARDEIGRAFAEKIQKAESSSELTEITKKILPDVEKFLETPEEKKMRRLRNGATLSFIGLGATVGFFLATVFGAEEEIIIMAAFGLVTLFIGVSLIINGLFFTTPKTMLSEGEAFGGNTEEEPDSLNATTNELLMPPPARQEFSSVTEPTTRHLKEKVKPREAE